MTFSAFCVSKFFWVNPITSSREHVPFSRGVSHDLRLSVVTRVDHQDFVFSVDFEFPTALVHGHVHFLHDRRYDPRCVSLLWVK